MMWTFIGKRRESGCVVTVETSPGRQRTLPLRLDWENHSPTGFEWGYDGSGPAQLALAILGEFLPKDQTILLHQKFKFEIISNLPRNDWTMTEDEIMAWVEKATTDGRIDNDDSLPPDEQTEIRFGHQRKRPR